MQPSATTKRIDFKIDYLSPLSGTLTRLGSGSLTPEQQQALQQLAAESQPTLAYAYGEGLQGQRAERELGQGGGEVETLRHQGRAG